jgi:hypothetical protein
MALTINQTPPLINLGQSPIAFSVIDGGYASSSFQYTCTLQIWTGSLSASGSGTQYALRKYPNASGYGIFDVSRFVNSSLTNLAYQATSSVVYFKPTFNYQYQTTFSGSNVVGNAYVGLDGYSVFPQVINASPTASAYWPLMTDGPQSQSIAIGDKGFYGVYVGEGANVNVSYTGSYSNGSTTTATKTVSGSTSNTTSSVAWVPAGPTQQGFPLALTNSGYDLVSYTIKSNGYSINNVIDCAYKYTPVRVLWKNRYGQFDWINFWYKNLQDFTTEQRTYQPQLGTWNASQLSYNAYQTATQRYIVDATQTITVNTTFLPQDYNEIFKQLLVTDEVYWMYDQPNSLVKPLTIKTSKLDFKTGVNDKLIQYTITFDIGQPFKLII